MFMAIMVTLGILLGLYWLYVALSSEGFLDLLLGIDEPYRPREWPKASAAKPYVPVYEEPKILPAVPVAPPIPLPRRNFGLHQNPLALPGQQDCRADFEQFDQRTWQCVACKLVRFEKPLASPVSEPMEASSNGPTA